MLFVMLLLCVAVVIGLVAGVVGCRGSRTRSRSRSRSPPSLFAAAAARYGTFLRSMYQVQSIDSLCSPLVPTHPFTFFSSSQLRRAPDARYCCCCCFRSCCCCCCPCCVMLLFLFPSCCSWNIYDVRWAISLFVAPPAKPQLESDLDLESERRRRWRHTHKCCHFLFLVVVVVVVGGASPILLFSGL